MVRNQKEQAGHKERDLNQVPTLDKLLTDFSEEGILRFLQLLKRKVTRLSQRELEKELNRDYFFYNELSPEFILNESYWPELRRLMGGKGLSLAIMTALPKINVPSGYTLPTTRGSELRRSGYHHLPSSLLQVINKATQELKDNRGGEFANPEKPLALSARSGAATSMPGAMDSILNIGMNEGNLPKFIELLGEERALECYHHFCFDWAASQLRLDKASLLEQLKTYAISSQLTTGLELTAERAQQNSREIENLKYWLNFNYELVIPNDPWDQLFSSILAIYRSYDSPEALKYRQRMGISDEGGTAVNVVNMVYGNLGEMSGSGVAFSHDPKTGEEQVQIEFKSNGMGDVVVAGDGEGFQQKLSNNLQKHLEGAIELLTKVSGEPIDLEFVVEKGEIYFVQFRGLRLTVPAMIKFLAEEIEEQLKLLPPQYQYEAQKVIRQFFKAELIASLGQRFTEESIENSRNNQTEKTEPYVLAKGQPIGGRANVGLAANSLETAGQFLDQGHNVVLILERLSNVSEILNLDPHPDQVLSIVTRKGSPSSHAAYVLGTENIAGAIGCKFLPEIEESTTLSVDGSTGEVHQGHLELAEQYFDHNLQQLIELRKNLGISSWETISERYELEERQYQLEREVEPLIRDFRQATESGFKDWQGPYSNKALTQEIINRVFPEEVRTEYHIVSLKEDAKDMPEVQREIEQKVKKGWELGFDVSVRSAFAFDKSGGVKKLGTNPWIIFKAGETERLNKFLYGELQDWRYGSLAAWKELETEHSQLTEVLLGYNHPGKLDEDQFGKHAVGVLSSPLTQTNLVKGSTFLDTPHLRSYEVNHYEAGQEITFKLNLSQEEIKPVLGFGSNHLDSIKIHHLIQKLLRGGDGKAQKELSPEEYSVRRDILLKLGIDIIAQPDWLKLDLAKVKQVLYEMAMEAELPDSIVKEIVNQRSYLRAKQIIERLIEEHLPAIAPGLAAAEIVMSRLDGFSSGISLEFQVGFSDAQGSEMEWMAVYGLKGFEEWLMALPPEE